MRSARSKLLGKMKINQIIIFFSKFIIAVRDGHCGFSLQARRNLATSLFGSMVSAQPTLCHTESLVVGNFIATLLIIIGLTT
jgi:hypothetical protein